MGMRRGARGGPAGAAVPQGTCSSPLGPPCFRGSAAADALRLEGRSLLSDIVHHNFTKIASSQWGNNAEREERRRGRGCKLSENTAWKKSMKFPSRGVKRELRYNLINTGSLETHLEMALNFCREHDQHALRSGGGQEIMELLAGEFSGRNLTPPKGSSRHFSEMKVCYLALFPRSLQSWLVLPGRGKGVQGTGPGTRRVPLPCSP